MIKNEHIQKAEEEYEYLTGDAEKRRLAELREKYIRDDAAAKISMERYGVKKGVKKEKKEIAKKMLAKGMDIKVIMEITELTEEEIKKL